MENNIKQKIIKAITEEGKSIKETASKLFMTERQLKSLLSSWGVEMPKKRKYNKVEMPDRNTLMMMYKKERTTQKVADFYDVGVNTVNRWMRELRIPTRKMKMSEEEKVKLLEEHIEKLNNVNL